MAKRWLYSQLIDEFLWPDECTEFLVAHQFIQGKVNNPTQPQTAFFRFLHHLANCNWKTDLFVLNFNDELTKAYVEKFETKFISDRDSFPPLTIITSNGEPDSHTIWSKKAPTLEILARVTLLARHANNLIKKSIFDNFSAAVGPLSIASNFACVNRFFISSSDQPLFHASLDGYDLVIKLHKNKVNNWLGHDFTKPLISIQQKKPFIPHADYNPVASYLHELRVTNSSLRLALKCAPIRHQIDFVRDLSFFSQLTSMWPFSFIIRAEANTSRFCGSQQSVPPNQTSN